MQLIGEEWSAPIFSTAAILVLLALLALPHEGAIQMSAMFSASASMKLHMLGLPLVLKLEDANIDARRPQIAVVVANSIESSIPGNFRQPRAPSADFNV